MRRRLGLAIAIALTLGCQPQPGPTTVKPRTTHTSKSKPSPSPSASASIVPGGNTPAPIPLSEPQRVVTTGTQAVELIGKVKLISDKGLGIISDNGASIISNNTGNLVSNNGGNVVSNNGGNYRLAQAGGTSAVPESLLAEAQIEVLDAAGQLLVTPDKQPITATTDQQGNYSLKTNLPTENLILRVRLYQGGQLFAFITKDKATATVNLDTASSLGAAYVMDKYVKKTQAVLNLLPGLEAEKLQADMEAARVHMASAVPSYQPQELVSTAEQLRGKAPQLEQTIKRIEAILVAGQSNLGNGLPATQVALAAPSGVAVDEAGNVYITENSAGRIRVISKGGLISTYAGTGAQAPRDGNLGIMREVHRTPDGSLYVVKRLAHQVVRIPPTGAPVVVAGNGTSAQGAVGGKATATPLLKPDRMFVTPSGRVYVAESTTFKSNLPARLLYVDDAGLLQQVPMPEGRWTPSEIDGFTVAPDGTIWVIARSSEEKAFLARLKPGGSWEFLNENLLRDSNIYMVIGPDGALYASFESQSQIMKFDDKGQKTVICGSSRAGYSGDGGPASAALINGPRGITFGADGVLYVCDWGNGLVRAIGKDGIIRTIAGTTGLTQVGDALTVSINQPTGFAIDPQGRLVIAEAASHTIKRLEGTTLTVIAGTTGGYAGDGGPATAAAFLRPNGIAYYGGELYILDFKNNRLRKIDKNGNVATLAGGNVGHPQTDRMAAEGASMENPVALAFSPEGIPYWTDNKSHVVMRLKDGFVERVAGQLAGVKGNKGDGGPALEAELSGPTGMCFDKAGHLYVADMGNLRVRKIDMKTGIITTVAGLNKTGMLALLGSGKGGEQNNEPGTASALWGPLAVLADDAGNLYISEAGTLSASAFGDGTDSNNALGFDTSLFPPDLVPKTYARIRKLTPDGKLVSVTGPGTGVLDDTAGDNMLLLPTTLIIDGQGRLVIGDSGQNQIKVLPKGSF